MIYRSSGGSPGELPRDTVHNTTIDIVNATTPIGEYRTVTKALLNRIQAVI
jgi:hypothetical protein